MSSEGLFRIIGPAGGADVTTVIITQGVFAVLVFGVVILMIGLLVNATVAPSPLKGWSAGGMGGVGWQRDYDAIQGTRKSLSAYLSDNSIDPQNTPINKLTVATANFGGIFTEDMGGLTVYNGTVSPEAARLQVEAGARAVVLDVWPDPRDLRTPVVCAMVDNGAWWTQRWWRDYGLTKGVGRYSNWQQLTRNVRPAGEIVRALVTAAFEGPVSQQNTDPFFLVFRLHGGMTVDYLNQLGDSVRDAIGGYGMSPEWGRWGNQTRLCSEPVASFMSKVFIMVSADISPNYNILPGVNGYPAFTAAFRGTRMGELTNAYESSANTMVVDPGTLSVLTAPSQSGSSCPGAIAGEQMSLVQTTLTVVQPSIGGTSTTNDALFSSGGSGTFQDCINQGVQMVAVNLFSAKTDDMALTAFFANNLFGKYSFNMR